LVRIIIPNGKIYGVMTPLLDSTAYPAGDFAALYHSRWRIEEAFKRLKQRMALENTSGLSWLAAQQDFCAKILADNLHSLTVLEAENYAPVKEGYKINRTYAFSHLKRCLPRWLLVALPAAEQLIATLTEILKNLIACAPDSSKPRPKHPKPHRKQAYKSTVQKLMGLKFIGLGLGLPNIIQPNPNTSFIMEQQGVFRLNKYKFSCA
jgi:hypothetical protein